MLMRGCNSNTSPTYIEGKSTTVTTYDTIHDSIPVYTPKYYSKTEYIYDTILKTKLDTIYIIHDYFTKYYYSDTINRDSITVIINDTIFRNKISSRNINYKFIIPTHTITKEIIVTKTELYIGGGLYLEKDNLRSIGPEFLLKTKNNTIYGVGAGVNQTLNPIIGIKLYKKIGK
jgi:hypothetical protein